MPGGLVAEPPIASRRPTCAGAGAGARRRDGPGFADAAAALRRARCVGVEPLRPARSVPSAPERGEVPGAATAPATCSRMAWELAQLREGRSRRLGGEDVLNCLVACTPATTPAATTAAALATRPEPAIAPPVTEPLPEEACE